MTPTEFSEEQLKRITDAWKTIVAELTAWFEQVCKAMHKLVKETFPALFQAHRAAVKRVHTAYRRKKGKRW